MQYVLDPIIKDFANFSGRASRPQFWWFQLWMFGGFVLLSAISGVIGTQLLVYVAVLGVFIPSLAITVRRLRDSGTNPWWILVTLLPLVGLLAWLYLMLLPSKPADIPAPDAG